MTDRELGMRAILAEPECDLHRLMWADEIELTESERAEFIRLQIELAMTPQCRHVWELDRRPDECRYCFMASREEWFTHNPEEGREPPAWVPDHWHPDSGLSVAMYWRRGFVSHVMCAKAAWLGEECGHAAEWVDDDDEQDRLFAESRAACPRCHGTGRTTAHGLAMVRSHPIERVTISDADPVAEGTACGWVRRQDDYGDEEYDDAREDVIPADVFDLLSGGIPRQDAVVWRCYGTNAEARADLSQAMLLWAKSKA